MLTAPLLLVLVALLQIGRAAAIDQSSYAGFGFGMFATYENELSRWIDVEITDGEGATRTVEPDDQLELIALEVPTDGHLVAIAREVIESNPDATAVTATIWAVAVDGRPLKLTPDPLTSVTIEVGS